jgi:periplasmic divalent cation tolerance protein
MTQQNSGSADDASREHPSFAIVLTTLPAGHDAEQLARTLVEERLVACANVLAPMQSIYRWQGRIEQDEERQVVMKTVTGRVPALRARLRELHPYDVPEFLVVPVLDGSEAYLDWVRDSTAGT